jgi:hypothetical protein
MLVRRELSAEERDHPVDPVKAREIMGFKDEEFKMQKFGQFVILPLAVCFALVLLLRGGFPG